LTSDGLQIIRRQVSKIAVTTYISMITSSLDFPLCVFLGLGGGGTLDPGGAGDADGMDTARRDTGRVDARGGESGWGDTCGVGAGGEDAGGGRGFLDTIVNTDQDCCGPE